MVNLYVPVSSEASRRAREFLASKVSAISGTNLVSSLEDADFVFTVFYNRIIPADFFERGGVGVNFHGSEIEKFRGVGGPIFPIIHGEKEICVTVHRLLPDIDTGAVLDRLTLTINPDDTGETVFKKMELMALEYFRQSWCDLMRRIMNERSDTKCFRVGRYFSRADLESAKNLTNFVRAFDSSTHEPAYYYDSSGVKHYLRYRS